MTDDNGNSNSSPLDAVRRYVPLAVWVIVILVVLAIPLKIIGYGYLPADDALRHAAKAVSGKPWPDILVVGPAFQIDHNFGWHFLLRQIYLWSKCEHRKAGPVFRRGVVRVGELVGVAVAEAAGSLADCA